MDEKHIENYELLSKATILQALKDYIELKKDEVECNKDASKKYHKDIKYELKKIREFLLMKGMLYTNIDLDNVLNIIDRDIENGNEVKLKRITSFHL